MSLDNFYPVFDEESVSTTVSSSTTSLDDGLDAYRAFLAEMDINTPLTEMESGSDDDATFVNSDVDAESQNGFVAETESDSADDATLVNSDVDSDSQHWFGTETDSDEEGDAILVNSLVDFESRPEVATVYHAALQVATDRIGLLEHECTRLTHMLQNSQQETADVSRHFHQSLLEIRHMASPAQPPSAPSPTDLAGDSNEVQYHLRVASRAVERADRLEEDLTTAMALVDDADIVIRDLREEKALAEQRDISQRALLESRERQINTLQDQLRESAEEVETLAATRETSKTYLEAMIDYKDSRIALLEKELEIRKDKDRVRRVYAKDLLQRLREEEAKNAAEPTSSGEPAAKRQRN